MKGIKNEEAILFQIDETSFNEIWERLLKEELEKKSYKKIDVKNKQRNKIITMDEHVSLYAIAEDEKKIEQYIEYFMEINKVLKRNYNEKIFFELIMTTKQIKLKILDPKFFKKEQMQRYFFDRYCQIETNRTYFCLILQRPRTEKKNGNIF